MERATVWSPEVEEAYRIQGSGWRNIREYRKAHGDPLRWENGFVKMTVHPKTGYFSTCFGVVAAAAALPGLEDPHGDEFALPPSCVVQ